MTVLLTIRRMIAIAHTPIIEISAQHCRSVVFKGHVASHIACRHHDEGVLLVVEIGKRETDAHGIKQKPQQRAKRINQLHRQMTCAYEGKPNDSAWRTHPSECSTGEWNRRNRMRQQKKKSEGQSTLSERGAWKRSIDSTHIAGEQAGNRLSNTIVHALEFACRKSPEGRNNNT